MQTVRRKYVMCVQAAVQSGTALRATTTPPQVIFLFSENRSVASSEVVRRGRDAAMQDR
eukprot:SAG31_NODE_613_length_13545_cov_10.972557_8_plen_59_part_00